MARDSIDDLKTRRDLVEESKKILDELKDTEAEIGGFAAKLFGLKKDINVIDQGILTKNKQGLQVTKDQSKQYLRAIKANKEIAESINDQLGFLKTFKNISKGINTVLSANPLLAIAAAVVGVISAVVKLNKALSETAKEFGVSRKEAALIEGKLKLAQFNGLGLSLTAEETRQAFVAINNELGSINNTSVSLIRNIARGAAETGTTADEFTKVLSIIESVSTESRDELVNSLSSAADEVRRLGVQIPSAVFKDLASNTEFFAQFAKDGGDNILQAAIQARKLGLNLGDVANISENLLDFETSIEKQLEASVLLGRQINLDRARQLALSGDQEGLLQEIQKQVGGEAEFTRLNVVQRKALAESVGLNVEQLSRLVRNQATTATGDAVSGVTDTAQKTIEQLGILSTTAQNQLSAQNKTNTILETRK
tara:strand:- start:229 stop:1506 length:1278 start_codon:yes stop_codon:yes gene_type:complete